jgi:hypothetical protein
MLWVFLAPLVTQSLHFHENDFVCKEKHEKHFHDQHEKCQLCDFLFSVFTLTSWSKQQAIIFTLVFVSGIKPMPIIFRAEVRLCPIPASPETR